jgi:hypothetical protein
MNLFRSYHRYIKTINEDPKPSNMFKRSDSAPKTVKININFKGDFTPKSQQKRSENEVKNQPNIELKLRKHGRVLSPELAHTTSLIKV